jgi:ribonuclease HII
MPDFLIETRLMRDGHQMIAGVDEVGRGPLAGPVVAAAVILNPLAIPEGLDDSKALSESERLRLSALILQTAHVGLCLLPPAEIDRLNIRGAALEAMRRAVAALPVRADFALIDGRDIPPGLGIPANALIKGDARSCSIAAASIVAKVLRDGLMRRLHLAHPQYGFDRNMGYPTAEHRAAITLHGATPHHRQSFRPFKNDTH